ncbi:LamG-like jellyroll fold domain-containing protein [Kitasatospora gansuensis]
MSNIAQFSPATTLGYLLTQPADRWKLADKTDSIRPNDLTLAGHSGWPNDATRGLVLGLDGTPGARASTAGPVINTTQSYTVSAWAYLTNTNGFATVVGQSGNSTSAFFLQYSAAFKSWTFTTPSVDDANLATYAAAYDPTLPALNTWTHLVGVYDATNQTISLYVNGTLVSTASNISTWPTAVPSPSAMPRSRTPSPAKSATSRPGTPHSPPQPSLPSRQEPSPPRSS